MICNAKQLSTDQKAAIESILGREVKETDAISIRALSPAPEWLRAVWEGAKKRGLESLSPDEIQAEIDEYRRHKS